MPWFDTETNESKRCYGFCTAKAMPRFVSMFEYLFVGYVITLVNRGNSTSYDYEFRFRLGVRARARNLFLELGKIDMFENI